MTLTKSENNLNIVSNSFLRQKWPLRVVITEATSYIARSLAYRIISGDVFGPDQEIIFSFFDTFENRVFMESTVIEISACAPNSLKDIIFSSDPSIAFKDADVIFSIGKARDYNFSRSDLRSDPFFKDAVVETKNIAKAIENYSKKSAIVITLGNTAAKIISEYAPSIPKENITAVSLILQNFAATLIAKKTDRLPSDVVNLIIWGTNSRLGMPYCNYAKFRDGKSVMEEIQDDTWCKKTLPTHLKSLFRKCRYRISEALALADHCKYLMQGTPEGEWICMSVSSDGTYEVPPGVFFSYPVYCKNGRWQIVQGLNVDDYCRTIMKAILVCIDKKVTAAMKICQQEVYNKPLRKSGIRKSIIKIPFNMPNQ